jgi:HSP20 family molecular chaperone IbpA
MQTKKSDTRPEVLREILPPVDIAEVEAGVRLSVEMPGAKSQTIAVTVEDDTLTVSAEREEFLGRHRLLHQESGRGAYRRSFRLSRDLAREKIRAEYRLGVLTLTLPRADHTLPRRIEVRTE